MRVYYAHSIAIYGTPQEARDALMLAQLGFSVVDPNQPENDAGYREHGMAWFNSIMDECDALAFRANPDGTINAGVMHEIQYMAGRDKPVFELPCGLDRRGLTVDQTRAWLRESGAR